MPVLRYRGKLFNTLAASLMQVPTDGPERKIAMKLLRGHARFLQAAQLV
jgi:hypothetical protein